MIKVISTTDGVKKVEFTAGMTAGEAISGTGFPVPGPDTAIKVRRDGIRMEVTSDMKMQDGDVVALAKSADGGAV